jgi:hypothetical protein
MVEVTPSPGFVAPPERQERAARLCALVQHQLDCLRIFFGNQPDHNEIVKYIHAAHVLLVYLEEMQVITRTERLAYERKWIQEACAARVEALPLADQIEALTNPDLACNLADYIPAEKRAEMLEALRAVTEC